MEQDRSKMKPKSQPTPKDPRVLTPMDPSVKPSDLDWTHKWSTITCVMRHNPETGNAEILLLRRKGGDALGSVWEPPGGLMEPDEDQTIFDAAAREVEQETGLKLLKPLGRQLHDMKFDKMQNTAIAFVGEVEKPTAEVKISQEHTDFQWAMKGKVAELKGSGDIRVEKAQVIEEAFDYYPNQKSVGQESAGRKSAD